MSDVLTDRVIAEAGARRERYYAGAYTHAMVLEVRAVPLSPDPADLAHAQADAMQLVAWLAGTSRCQPVVMWTFDAVTGLRFLGELAAAPATFRGSFSGGRSVSEVAAQLEADLRCVLVVASTPVHRDAQDAANS